MSRGTSSLLAGRLRLALACAGHHRGDEVLKHEENRQQDEEEAILEREDQRTRHHQDQQDRDGDLGLIDVGSVLSPGLHGGEVQQRNERDVGGQHDPHEPRVDDLRQGPVPMHRSFFQLIQIHLASVLEDKRRGPWDQADQHQDQGVQPKSDEKGEGNLGGLHGTGDEDGKGS